MKSGHISCSTRVIAGGPNTTYFYCTLYSSLCIMLQCDVYTLCNQVFMHDDMKLGVDLDLAPN